MATHLLGGNLGRLWARPESGVPEWEPREDFDTLLSYINRENELWVRAARRIGPEPLIEFLDLTDHRLYEHFRGLDPTAPAQAAVAWAGASQSPNWFDIAREYTEKWLHQQHLREAMSRPLLLERHWYFPVLDTFMRGMPHAYREVVAAEGTAVAVKIVGDAGGAWTLRRSGRTWQLFEGSGPTAACRLHLDQDLAWRLFSKGVSPGAVRPQVRIDGREDLGTPLLKMVSIMA